MRVCLLAELEFKNIVRAKSTEEFPNQEGGWIRGMDDSRPNLLGLGRDVSKKRPDLPDD